MCPQIPRQVRAVRIPQWVRRLRPRTMVDFFPVPFMKPVGHVQLSLSDLVVYIHSMTHFICQSMYIHILIQTILDSTHSALDTYLKNTYPWTTTSAEREKEVNHGCKVITAMETRSNAVPRFGTLHGARWMIALQG